MRRFFVRVSWLDKMSKVSSDETKLAKPNLQKGKDGLNYY